MKILNLYAGIGGNRKLWGTEHEVTAVESEQYIADIYQQFFPNDTVIVGDAHQYLLEHYKEYDFIWSSPPCPTHSKLQMVNATIGRTVKYPDMSLYQEVIWLKHFYYGKWIVENVQPFYTPLINPRVVLDRHCIWSNFPINRQYFGRNYGPDAKYGHNTGGITNQSLGTLSRAYGITLPPGSKNGRKLLRNAVLPEMGQYILQASMHNKQEAMFTTAPQPPETKEDEE